MSYHMAMPYIAADGSDGSAAAMQEVKSQDDPDLLVLETDNVLVNDEGFRCGTPKCIMAEQCTVVCPPFCRSPRVADCLCTSSCLLPCSAELTVCMSCEQALCTEVRR